MWLIGFLLWGGDREQVQSVLKTKPKCFERSPSRKSCYFNYLVNANKPSVFLAQNEALTTYKESVNVALCLEGLKNLVSKGTVIHK